MVTTLKLGIHENYCFKNDTVTISVIVLQATLGKFHLKPTNVNGAKFDN